MKSGITIRAAALTAIALGPMLFLAERASGAAAAGLPVPFTLLELMRANVEIPSDGIWGVQGKDKLSDEEWLLADQDAINLGASAAFISTGGTGANDAKRAANADYQAFARDVQTTALAIRAAVKAKDTMKLNDAANHLLDVCQGCHDKYRPEHPSDGVERFPFYPARALKKTAE